MSYLGVIEGFYGSFYKEQERKKMFSFMNSHDYNFYIYAPKNDARLRKTWDKDNSKERYAYLEVMSAQAKNSSLDFGAGLSPLNISLDYDTSKKDFLLTSVKSICSVKNTSIFALLFDDVKLQCEDIGSIQNTIIKEVQNALPYNIKKFIVCPSYYTFDPVLDKIFGLRPGRYFKDLIDGIDTNVDFFWTGNKVLSDDITAEDVQKANALFNRKVFIWDNYPVNDGRKISQYIYTKSFKGRRALENITAGHGINPMLEPHLSLISMLTLPLVYKGVIIDDIETARLNYLHGIFKNRTDMILEFFDEVLLKGLDNINEDLKEKILELCRSNAEIPEYNEIKDYLEHVYVFDPDYPDTE